MSAPLSKDLRAKYSVRSAPVRKDDEVLVVRGGAAIKNKDGKVLAVRRGKYVIHVEKCTKDKANGQPVPIGIHPSNVIITKLAQDKNREALLKRRGAAKTGAKAETDKGKDSMSTVD